MTDGTLADGPDAMPGAAVARTAGGLLRAARQAQGLHIAALAASIKVVPKKLEWLEADQFDHLPDATFTRALAQTVCRTLKIDPAPVLALLPPIAGNRLDQVAEGLNTPFHERPGRLVAQEWSRVASPALWLALALLVAAVAVYLVPAQWFSFMKPTATRAAAEAPPSATTGPFKAASTAPATLAPTAANALSAAGDRAAGSASTIAMTPPQNLADSQPGPEATTAPPPGILQLHASAASWIDVTDARGQTLIARQVQPNESVALDGVMPFKLKVGNAKATTLVFRGEPVELEPFTRDNVARLVLK